MSVDYEVDALESDEIESIVASATSFRTSKKASAYTLPESFGGSIRLAAVEAFGENVTGKVSGRKKSVYAAAIAALEGNLDPSRVAEIAGSASSIDELGETFESALIDAGFVTEDEETGEETLALPAKTTYSEVPTTSLGPVMPVILALLSVRGEVDVSEAIEKHG